MFYLFLFAHLVADFALQPLWLVRRKRHWNGLLIHVGIVLGCMLVLVAVESQAAQLWPVMLAVGAVHLAADRWKVRYADALLRPPFVPFVLDQLSHIGTLAVALSLALPAAQVWALDASPLALPALIASGYLAVALAAPIGLIVLLDPGFVHADCALRARVRSLVAAVAVLTLALLAGPAALPITLAGIAIAVHYPGSNHPLDTPASLFAVTIAAAATGAALSMAV